MADPKSNRMSKADRPEEDDEFPRMLFRASPNGVIVPGGFAVDHIIVGNKSALANALDHGWHLDPQAAQEASDKEEDERMRRREGKGGKDSDRPRDKNFREVDQHSYNPDAASETADNPRPNEPDNAPFQNTPYVEPQTGDLADPPTSPAERPVPAPIPPGEAKPPGEEADPDGRRDRLGNQLPPNYADQTLPPEGPGNIEKPDGQPPLGGSRAADKSSGEREKDKDGGAKTDREKSDREKGAPPKGPGRPSHKR